MTRSGKQENSWATPSAECRASVTERTNLSIVKVASSMEIYILEPSLPKEFIRLLMNTKQLDYIKSFLEQHSLFIAFQPQLRMKRYSFLMLQREEHSIRPGALWALWQIQSQIQPTYACQSAQLPWGVMTMISWVQSTKVEQESYLGQKDEIDCLSIGCLAHTSEAGDRNKPGSDQPTNATECVPFQQAYGNGTLASTTSTKEWNVKMKFSNDSHTHRF